MKLACAVIGYGEVVLCENTERTMWFIVMFLLLQECQNDV
jgi:hypothetical protein